MCAAHSRRGASRGRYRDGEGTDHATVQGNAVALACGAVPPERVASVADYAVSKGFSCSTYMAQFVLEALFMAGRDRDAIALMTSPAHRGWLAMMATGATITPEFWDITMPEEGRIPDMNHAWSTAPLNAITRFVAGVRPTAPGFAVAEIAPQFGPLTHVQATVPTPRGPVSLDLHRNGAAISGTVTIPTGIQATFAWHGRHLALRAGTNDVR